MRPAEQMAILRRQGDSQRGARAPRPKRRSGAAAVVDAKRPAPRASTRTAISRAGTSKDVNIGQDAKLAQVMTAKPVTVRVDKLAVEVLNLFEANRIDDLVVVDRQHRPVGLVDAQDLARFKLI